MESKRKIQFGAAAVVANGLLALSAMHPLPAFANPCSSFDACGLPQGACTPANATNLCNGRAPAGCTVTSYTCTANLCAVVGGGIPLYNVTCNFH
jgi:hypothetical protein